jgi:four helix bundle protein
MTNYRPSNIQDRTFAFGIRIVKLADCLPRRHSAMEISKQLLRSGTSIGANVQEADGAESHKDFVHKIGIARKEAQESHYWLRIIDSAILPDNSEVLSLLDEAGQLSRILYAISHSDKT